MRADDYERKINYDWPNLFINFIKTFKKKVYNTVSFTLSRSSGIKPEKKTFILEDRKSVKLIVVYYTF